LKICFPRHIRWRADRCFTRCRCAVTL
jgi:hypothetical protein